MPIGPTTAIGRPGGGSAPGPLGITGSWMAWSQEAEHVPELRWPENRAIYERMLFTDAQVISLYLGTTLPILDYLYWLVEPEDPSQELAAYAQALADDLGLPLGEPDTSNEPPNRPGLFRFDFSQHLSEALLALGYGHYYFEQEGVIEGGLWRLRRLGPRAPQTIEEFDVAEDGGLRSIRQNGVVAGTAGRAGLSLGRVPPIPVDRLIGYIWMPDSRARWTGRSMLRSLYRHWVVKDRLIRVDAINHERAGGVPWAKTDQTWQGTSLTELAEMASQFRVGEDSGGATPPGVTMELLRAGGTDVIGSINYHDDAMARVWSAQVRQLAQGGDSANRAVGQTFAGLEDLARRAVARWFAGTFREHMIEDWWNYNVPLVNGRLPAHPGLGYRPRSDGPGPPEPEGGGIPPQVAARSRPRRDRDGAAGRDGGVSAALTLPDRPLRRQPTADEVRAATDFAGMDLAYEGGAMQAEAWLARVLPEQVQALADAVLFTKKGEPRKILTKTAMARIQAPVLGAEGLADLLLPVARAGATSALSEALSQGVQEVVVPSDEALIAAVRDHAQAVAEQHAHGLALAAQRRAVQVVAGRTIPEVAAEVSGYLAGLKHQWTVDQLHGAVQMALNTGRFAVMEQVPDEIPQRFQASELLDAATCGPCAMIDGTEWPTLAEAMRRYPSGGYSECDGGPRCRGTVVAIYAEL